MLEAVAVDENLAENHVGWSTTQIHDASEIDITN